MRYEIALKGSYALLRVFLSGGESVVAEPGAMVYMRGPIEVQTSVMGGVWKALKRAVLGGENFFMNTYVSRGEGEIGFAPQLPGDIDVIPMNGTLYVQSTSYLASDPSVEMDVSFGGFKTFFAGEGIFLLKLQGEGDVAVSSFGGIRSVTLQPGEEITVDTGHVVALRRYTEMGCQNIWRVEIQTFGRRGPCMHLHGTRKGVHPDKELPCFC
ncbi:Putative uncharacterized protein [Thermotoga neapolitana DSM 4359]|uniref:TIGR00266 family protein n=1 Tax=Thermotoga neapolitana (strain ATCC 49049 / DSM 4359 / NBRC 107923 / NS-E) TaxID=309803 RepID=B9KBS7_THENN|nr:Putative uncharacterized protein [Thermotoga neapolitana DSM 4359]